MERLLLGIEGVVPYFDDVLISAGNSEQLQQRLRKVLSRFRDVGLKVKKNKCSLAEKQIEFLGYLIDESGIRPTPGKLRAIKEAPSPKNKTELQAFLGLLNFYNIFLPQKATIAEPLHRLLDKTTEWKWGEKEKAAFKNIKKLLISDRVLVQYSGTLPLRLTCDASPFGIGAVLSHCMPSGKEAPIAFYSRTLSKPERNYSQLDKEALAAVAGIKRFHEYVYGRKFKLITDHKPLLGIIAGDKPTPPILSPRMIRWIEFLAAYNYKLRYKPGKEIDHADALSRCPLPNIEEDPALASTTLLIETMESTQISAADIARATAKDKTLARVLNWIWKGWPETEMDTDFQPFKSRRNELSGLKGCVLWGDRVIIPTVLRQDILNLLHEGHPGIVKMKALARSYVWWPGMDKEIESWVAGCTPCQESRPAPHTAPTHDWENPGTPWSRIQIDFAGPCQGNMFLIIVDAFSKWLEVFLMPSTTTEAVIRVLRRLFATHGLPDLVVSDNGPQFTANTFEMFLANQGIRHALSAPGKPSTNGLAERMVRTTKETLARLGPGDMQAKIDKLLTIQHITPSATTHRSPAELLMGRKLRSPLDRLHPQYSTEKPTDSTSKIRQFQVGDKVYAKNLNGNPLWIPGTITQVTGPLSYRLQTEDERQWKRHIDQIRGRITRNTAEPTGKNQPQQSSNDNERKDISQDIDSSGSTEEEPSESSIGNPLNLLGEEGRNSTPAIGSERAPEAEPAEPRNPNSHSKGTGTTELRRSTRESKHPAYLRDYVA